MPLPQLLCRNPNPNPDPNRPFFAYIAPKAAHEPFDPAPWYAGAWDASWPEHEPRPVNWNCSAEARSGHAGVVPSQVSAVSSALTLTLTPQTLT